MRLSVILLVVAAFVAALDPASAANNANTVVAATNVHESITTGRFLRAHLEDDYPVKDEEDSDDNKEKDEERMFSFFQEKATALNAFKKLISESGDDLAVAVSGLSKSEFVALFNQGKAHMAKMVPGFYPGMSLDEFATVVGRAGLSDDFHNALLVGYGKYLAHLMD
uniref:RxLR effector protein n=1 Tax=Phytophthora capsici TaxID=4784 RepID=A0A977P2K1_PHYCP|nr:RXLR242 effector [Phytophthora capsici]